MDNDRLEKLEEEVANLKKLKGYKAAAEFKVVDLARQYAMMKTFGKSIDSDNCMISYCSSDVEARAEYLKDELLRAAQNLLLEDALSGSQS